MSTTAARVPTTQQMAGAFLQFDLESEIAPLRREQGWNDGHIAKTLVKQDGHVRMHALGRTFDLPAGSLLSLDREVSHDVVALEESAILVTISWRGEESPVRLETKG